MTTCDPHLWGSATGDPHLLVGPKRDATLLTNYYETLGEVSDEVSFTQNMQQFHRYEHRAKLTKADKKFHQEWQEECGESSDEVKVTRKRKSIPKRNRHYPRISPITVPGKPDNLPESPKRPKRFPEPDSHTETTTISHHLYKTDCSSTNHSPTNTRKKVDEESKIEKNSPRMILTSQTMDS